MKTNIAQVIFGVPLIALVAVAQQPAGSTPSGAAVQAAASTRPPQVPENYVITPFGYFHPSCVQHVAEGETLLQDGRIQHADGRVDTIAPVCDYPRYSPQGALLTSGNMAGTGTPPTTNGWVESLSAITGTSYGRLTATWRTPPLPSANNGQTLFFFPGFEDINHVISIVQPVLQFGPSGAGGGNYWAAASWNCCISGVADYSTLIRVSSGDSILGWIGSTCAPGGISCPTWNVVTQDRTTGAKTTLSKTPSDGQVWNWAFGAVMEVYNVVQCTNYPRNKGVTFSVRLYDQNLVQISNPGWTENPAGPGITPNCSFGLNSTASQETVNYLP
jgi:hypothetical protein